MSDPVPGTWARAAPGSACRCSSPGSARSATASPWTSSWAARRRCRWSRWGLCMTGSYCLSVRAIITNPQ